MLTLSVVWRPSGLPWRPLVTRPAVRRIRRVALPGLLLLATCMAARAEPALPGSIDPELPVPPLVYRDVTAGTRTYRPVGPRNWIDQNRAVTGHGGGMAGMPGMDHGSMGGMGGK